ncbi:MAG: hypothetical protein AB4372_30750 [Xenococcus sp. (in: cyanobacteria)]
MGIGNLAKKAAEGLKNIQQATKLQFDEQLALIGLKQDQIETQSLQELKDSLERINDAINNPDSFPKFNIGIGGPAGIPYVTQGAAKAHYQITILPTLLERKKIILDRIRLLEKNEKVETLQEFINKKVIDKEVKENLTKELNQYITESQDIKEQYQQVIKAQSEQLEKSDSEKMKLSMELWERRSKVLLSFLERESAATIIGAILLIIIALAYVASLVFGISIPETLNSAFLLILGYFFGQSTNRDSSTKNSQEDENDTI